MISRETKARVLSEVLTVEAEIERMETTIEHDSLPAEYDALVTRRNAGHALLGSTETELIGSWIVVSRETGNPVLETFHKRTADAVNLAKYEVLTAHEWLARFNRRVKETV